MNWKDIKIAKKLYIGFGLVLSLTAAVGLIGINGSRRLDAGSRIVSGGFNLALTLKDIAVARRDYQLTFDQKYADRVKQLAGELQRRAEEIKAQLNDPVDQQTLADVCEQTETYLRDFENYVGVMREAGQSRPGRDIERRRSEAADRLSGRATTLVKACMDFAAKKDADTARSQDSVTLLMIGFASAAILLGIIIAYFIARGISRPLAAITRVSNDIAVGNIQQPVEVRQQDEIGLLAESFRRLIDYMKNLAHAAEEIANGNLTGRVEPRGSSDVLGNAFQTMISNLGTIVRQLTDNARELVSAATEIASSSEQMSKGAKDQADQVTQISTAVEEMSATILESSKNAGEATEVARGASELATSGGQVVNETIHGMQSIAQVVQQSAESISKLAKSADQIGEITGVIDDIADQTNLLALNAAIEAARAGEQGRGFAVVADEVRKLAERTGKATKEITDMIKGIQGETNEAVQSMESGIRQVDKGRDLADKAGSSLTEIVGMSGRVMDMIAQMATASEEQSSAAEQISRNIEHIASVTKETSVGAEQSAAAAEELNRQAEGLQQMIGRFRLSTTELLQVHAHSLSSAKTDHQKYIENLGRFVSGQAAMDDWKYTDHRSCRFGKWYYSNGGRDFGSESAFAAIEVPHRRVHECANAAARALVNGDQNTARTQFAQAESESQAVVAAITELEQLAHKV